MPRVNSKVIRLAQAKEGCEDSNREACEAGQRAICEDGCGGDEECLAQCLNLRPCDTLFPDPCNRCRGQCFTEEDECYEQCRETCETDPDGIECHMCQVRCRCASENCIYDNCRSPCGWDAPQGAASVRNAFQPGDLSARRAGSLQAFGSRRVGAGQVAGYLPKNRPQFRLNAFNRTASGVRSRAW
jgi:hypothetical protein